MPHALEAISSYCYCWEETKKNFSKPWRVERGIEYWGLRLKDKIISVFFCFTSYPSQLPSDTEQCKFLFQTLLNFVISGDFEDFGNTDSLDPKGKIHRSLSVDLHTKSTKSKLKNPWINTSGPCAIDVLCYMHENIIRIFKWQWWW